MYSSECASNSELKRRITKLTKEIENLKHVKKQSFLDHDKNKAMQEKPLKRKRKEWDDIKSERTKRRRIVQYRDDIFKTLNQINGCHRSELTVWIGSDRFNLSWKPKHFEDKPTLTAEQKGFISDHTYSLPKELDDSDEEIQDINFSEIYDGEGKWKKEHIRRLIHVMDCFRISNETYHEIRMVSKGHLPPIGQMRKEKKIMSQELPYIKHPKVHFSALYDLIILNMSINKAINYILYLFNYSKMQCEDQLTVSLSI